MMEKKLEQIVDFIKGKQADVNLIYVFGSVAEHCERSDSDIDIAVLFRQPVDNVTRWEWAQELAILLNQDVDLVDLSTCSTVLRFQVIQNGKCMFDDGSSAEFENVTLSMYQHLQESRGPIIEEYVKDQLHG